MPVVAPASRRPAASGHRNDRRPVATPLRYRWRDFRTGLLPGVVFLGCVLGIALLWRHEAAAPTFVAEAETVRAELKCAQPGTLAVLSVRQFQAVTAGEIVGRVHVSDPRVLAASLALIRAEMDLLRAGLEPLAPAQRVALDSDRLRLDWMRERVALASLRVQLHLAEANLTRLGPLRERNAITERDYDAARHDCLRLTAQVAEQEKLIAAFAPAETAAGAGLPIASAADTLAAALRVQEAKLVLAEAQLAAVPLVAPVAGVVVQVHRCAGETVAAGEPIVTLAAPQPTHLVGFLRQPLAGEPRRGTIAELRGRGAARQTGSATVLEVGRVLEPVPPSVLVRPNRANLPELGLRVHLSIPLGFRLHPGEQVDVILRGR